MSLRFALLGLLAEGPASGYDLTQRFEQGIGSFAWTARHSQIYPELTKLATEGLVEVGAEGPRGRRAYSLAPPGRQALRDWLVGPHTDGATVRNEFVLRLFLLQALEDDDAHEVLAGVSTFAEAQIAVLEGQQAEMREAGIPLRAGPSWPPCSASSPTAPPSTGPPGPARSSSPAPSPRPARLSARPDWPRVGWVSQVYLEVERPTRDISRAERQHRG